jgi:hypothetical protein
MLFSRHGAALIVRERLEGVGIRTLVERWVVAS